MKKINFENRSKAMEKLFDIIFWIQFIAVIMAIVYKILYLKGIVKSDPYTYQIIAINIGYLIFLFISTRLAKKGHVVAGIIGIIVGIGEFITGEILGIILYLLLFINSISYLDEYYKK